ncbi:MAG TPA: hypothetical protein VK608_06470 [Edaphobacter sp.]|nr:hypothetical protein [Edaphobacter sp.]
MAELMRVGRILFAVAMAFFGVQYLIYASHVAGPAPGPPWTPSSQSLAWLAGVGLLGAAVCLVTKRQGRLAATLLGIVLLLRLLLVHLPGLIARPHDPGMWTTAFEILALCGAAFVLAGTLSGEWPRSQAWDRAVDTMSEVGRFLFAIALVVFGVQHFMYAKFVAMLVPAWIPEHLFWAYFVGVAFIAAAVSVATNKSARLAASLLGTMFLLWVILLHAPRVAAAGPHNGNEWTSEFVALAMCGGSFVLAGALSSGPGKRGTF